MISSRTCGLGCLILLKTQGNKGKFLCFLKVITHEHTWCVPSCLRARKVLEELCRWTRVLLQGRLFQQEKREEAERFNLPELVNTRLSHCTLLHRVLLTSHSTLKMSPNHLVKLNKLCVNGHSWFSPLWEQCDFPEAQMIDMLFYCYWSCWGQSLGSRSPKKPGLATCPTRKKNSRWPQLENKQIKRSSNSQVHLWGYWYSTLN